MNLHQNGAMNCNYRHGLHGSKLYEVWKTMRQRCRNHDNPKYAKYGARGISVCKEWDNYISFYEWAMRSGYKEGLSIERRDVNKGYCPENCSWIPMNQQAKNTTRNIWITVNGVTHIQSDWAKISGVDNSTLSKLRRSGANVQKIIGDAFAYRRKPEPEGRENDG